MYVYTLVAHHTRIQTPYTDTDTTYGHRHHVRTQTVLCTDTDTAPGGVAEDATLV